MGTKYIVPALLVFLFLPSCKITQELDNGEKLVNKVKIEGIEDNDLEDGAKQLIKQKPNKRIFGFWRFYLRSYNYGMRGDTSKWIRRTFRNKIGEPPVIVDTTKLNSSAEQISAYLFNNGYFNNRVTYTVTPKKSNRKKATVVFNVKENAHYTIGRITYGVDERILYFEVVKDTSNAKIHEGDYFSADKLSEERERITERLRNLGYYYFNKEYIVYSVDTGMVGNKVNIDLQIRNPGYFTTHTRYYINKVYINVVSPNSRDTNQTMQPWKGDSSFMVNMNGYYLNKDLLVRRVAIAPGLAFNQDDVDKTYNQLNNLQLFKQANITFKRDSADGLLNCYINLVPGKRQEIVLEPQIISSDQNNAVEQNNLRNYGLANVISYRNKNLSRRAETFELRYRISLEGQLRKNDSLPFLNNIEHGVTGTLGLPRIALLKPLKEPWELRNTRSTLQGNFTYESNIDFIRRVLSLGYSELFSSKNQLHNFNITLFEVSYNETNAKRDFLSLVNPADSIFIANLFTTNLITNTRLTWIYNDKILSRSGTHFFSRISFESAGLSLRSLMQATNQPLPADGIYKINNVNFEQFVKLDADLRYTCELNELHSLAYRFHTGVGLPYGNSPLMPFVRRYFIGGANSLRGWRPRTLGPGSFTNTASGVRADRSGEMIIEAQAEYRFSLIRNLMEGAIFADAGNIWYTHGLEGREGVQFKLKTFADELAVSSGFGLRFDFSFFVLRFDFGFPLRNPELASGKRWLFDDYRTGERKFFSSLILNIGLGYPF